MSGRRGREARREARAASAIERQPFLTCALSPIELLSTEGLELLEHNAETILEEVGIEVRDHPSTVARFADAGADVDGTRVRFPRAARPPARVDCAGAVRAARPQPRQQRAGRRRRHRVRPQLRLAVRPRPRPRPALRHARGLRELRQAGVPPSAPAPLGRHGVRTGRRARRRPAPRHGLRPPAVERQADDGLGDRDVEGGRQRGDGAHRLRRRPRRSHRADQPDQRRLAAGVDGSMLGAAEVYAEANQATIITPFILAGAMAPSTSAGSSPRRSPRRWPGSRSSSSCVPARRSCSGRSPARCRCRRGPRRSAPRSRARPVRHRRAGPPARLPFRSGGSLTASKLPDAQAAYESAATLLPTIMAGTHFVLHAAGWLEGGLAVGYEKFVLDADQLGMMATFAGGIDLSENGQALDAIRASRPATTSSGRRTRWPTSRRRSTAGRW